MSTPPGSPLSPKKAGARPITARPLGAPPWSAGRGCASEQGHSTPTRPAWPGGYFLTVIAATKWLEPLATPHERRDRTARRAVESWGEVLGTLRRRSAADAENARFCRECLARALTLNRRFADLPAVVVLDSFRRSSDQSQARGAVLVVEADLLTAEMVKPRRSPARSGDLEVTSPVASAWRGTGA